MKTLPTKIIRLALDSHAAEVSDTEKTGEFFGSLLIHSIILKHLARHIESFGGKTRFVSPDSLDKVKKIFNRKVSFYIRKWRSEEEQRGVEKAYKYLQEDFKNLIKEKTN